ncbi:MAG: hypothetical protein JXQ91_09985 [Vannielia sp.]|uniref:hypothetical protein n=1 Tax=Rhodobacterales TaxID=204455 RepID=UPI0020948A6D|nr:hypothetical protein [Oceanicola sp. 502str15]MCO6384691.1 hypothetical protein [Oceanicola sp. 502str15]
MMTQTQAPARPRALTTGKCLGCTGCKGACREVLDLLAVPEMVLKPKGRAA